MLIIDDDGAGQNAAPLTVQFVTPPFDGTIFSTINLSVDIHFRDYETSSFSIFAFDGNEFVQLTKLEGFEGTTGDQFSEFTTFTADLSFYANPNMQLMFEFDDGDTWAWWAGFDNVMVTGSGTETNIILEDFNDCALPTGWTSSIITGENAWQFGFVDNNNAAANSINGTCFGLF